MRLGKVIPADVGARENVSASQGFFDVFYSSRREARIFLIRLGFTNAETGILH